MHPNIAQKKHANIVFIVILFILLFSIITVCCIKALDIFDDLDIFKYEEAPEFSDIVVSGPELAPFYSTSGLDAIRNEMENIVQDEPIDGKYISYSKFRKIVTPYTKPLRNGDVRFTKKWTACFQN